MGTASPGHEGSGEGRGRHQQKRGNSEREREAMHRAGGAEQRQAMNWLNKWAESFGFVPMVEEDHGRLRFTPGACDAVRQPLADPQTPPITHRGLRRHRIPLAETPTPVILCNFNEHLTGRLVLLPGGCGGVRPRVVRAENERGDRRSGERAACGGEQCDGLSVGEGSPCRVG